MDLLRYQTNDPYYTKVFEVLKGCPNIAGDGETYSHSVSDIELIQHLTHQEIYSSHVKHGINVQSLDGVRDDLTCKFRKIAGDGFYNPISGVGMHGTDPQMFTRSNIPVVFGPMETCSIYTNGGLPAVIIDKKSRGLLNRGVTFRSKDEEFWSVDKISQLEEAAEITGLNEMAANTVRDALIMGGCALYPIFTDDNKRRFDFSLDGLHLEKGCIKRWLSIDRWNIVYVPSFIITAEDYLHPKHIYIPLGGYSVNSERVAFVRPKSLPYWSVMFNLGWCPSDYSGYIRSLLSYQMFIMATTIMSQQMSLLLYQMPLDSMQATLGPKAIKELMEVNQQKLREWSILNPGAVNMVGEVKIVERTYSGFDQFAEAIKGDLAAQSGLAQPAIFHTPNKGFQDNTKEAAIKQDETMRLLASNLEHQFTSPVVPVLIAHVFGSDSEEWAKKDTLFLSFDKPIPQTELDMAEIAARFSASVASLAQAGVPPDVAMKVSQQFFKSVVIEEEIFQQTKENAEKQMKLGESAAKAKQQGLASPGRAGQVQPARKG
jgi:hypothetical protein